MEQYNYTPPTQSPPEQDPNNQWFNSLPNEELPQAPKPAFSKKPFIIAAAVMLLLGSIIIALFVSRPTAAQCLTPADYKALSGQDFQDVSAFSPSDSFFDTTIVYDNGKASWSTATSKKNMEQIKKIAYFYNDRIDEDKSVVVTLQAGYTKNDTKEAAQLRITTILTEFSKNGMDASLIRTSDVLPIESGDELADNSAELLSASVYITVTSDQSCRI